MASEWDNPAARKAVFDAVKKGNVAAVQDAVDRGFPPTAVDVHCCTLLLRATHSGRNSVVPYLVANHWDVNATDGSTGACAIQYACWWDRLDIMQLLERAGASLETVDNHGWGVAHYAASNSSCRVLEWLAQRPEVDWLGVTCIGATVLNYTRDDVRRVAIVKGAMAAQRERKARWSLLRAAFVGAVAVTAAVCG
jgi:ankyrin repeat protein